MALACCVLKCAAGRAISNREAKVDMHMHVSRPDERHTVQLPGPISPHLLLSATYRLKRLGHLIQSLAGGRGAVGAIETSPC